MILMQLTNPVLIVDENSTQMKSEDQGTVVLGLFTVSWVVCVRLCSVRGNVRMATWFFLSSDIVL